MKTMGKCLVIISAVIVALGLLSAIVAIPHHQRAEELNALYYHRGVLARPEIEQEMAGERATFYQMVTLAISLEVLGFGIIGAMFVTKKGLVAIILTLIFLLLPNVRAEAPSLQVAQNRIAIPRGSFCQINVTQVVLDQTVRSGFVAFPFGILDTVTKEWIEVGYWENMSGIYIYSTSWFNHHEICIDIPATVGATYIFTVDSQLLQASVSINNVVINTGTFSSQNNLVYVMQAESISYSQPNDMDTTFYHPTTKKPQIIHAIEDGIIEPWSITDAEITEQKPYSWNIATSNNNIITAQLSGKNQIFTITRSGGYKTVFSEPIPV